MDIYVNMPDIGIDEVEVTEILVSIGEQITLEQGLITVEGDKSSMEVPSSVSGIVKKIHLKVGDKIKTSCLIVTLVSDEIVSDSCSEDFQILEKKESLLNKKKQCIIHASPLIRRLARKLNINLSDVIASGRKNRILKEDIELYKKNYIYPKKESHVLDINNINLPVFNTLDTEEISLTAIQKLVGKNLYNNWINIPHVTHFEEVNITLLDQFRQKYNKEKENSINKITILVFIIKVLALSLEKFPLFNSSLSLDKNKIILKKYINIGIAIDITDGLVVAVLKDVNKKNILDISYDLKNISKKARAGKLEKKDIQNSTFTISNLGGISSGWFSPIINSPEVAILGVSRALFKPVWNNKEFIPELMLPISLSYDHRVINGADAARFIVFIKKMLSEMHFLIM